MTDRWFRLPESADGTAENPYRPDLMGYDVNGYSGAKTCPDGAPIWTVRVYGDSSVLDSLAGEPKVVDLSGVPVTALNNITGQTRDGSGWMRRFEIQ